MPIFDVLVINEKHLAKVNVSRQTMLNEISNDIQIGNVMSTTRVKQLSFIQWQKYIRDTNKKTKSLHSVIIKRIFA